MAERHVLFLFTIMPTKEDLLKRFQELDEQKNTIITEQIKINGKLELLAEQEKEQIAQEEPK